MPVGVSSAASHGVVVGVASGPNSGGGGAAVEEIGAVVVGALCGALVAVGAKVCANAASTVAPRHATTAAAKRFILCCAMEEAFRRLRLDLSQDDERDLAAIERRLHALRAVEARSSSSSSSASSSSISPASSSSSLCHSSSSVGLLSSRDEAVLERHGSRLARSFSTPSFAPQQQSPPPTPQCSTAAASSASASSPMLRFDAIPNDATARRRGFG